MPHYYSFVFFDYYVVYMNLLLRNGTELVPVTSDVTYDYNFQETRRISPRKEIRKGDSLQTICTYSTKDKDTFVEVCFLNIWF